MLSVLLASVLIAVSAPRPAATIATGKAPCGAATGFGAVWVAADGAGTLERIDPRANRVTRRVRLGAGACSVATGAGAVWVVNYRTSMLARVDPRTLRARFARVDAAPFDVLVAFGRVWVTAWEAGTLDELDPGTLEVVRRIDVGPRPAGLTVHSGGVWVGFGLDVTSIARIDRSSGAVTRFQLDVRRPGWFAAGTADFWITANDSDLLHVDPSAGTVLARLHLGGTLVQGAAAPDGTIWVPDKERSVVHRVDPARERLVDSLPAGPGAYLALRAFGSMWVLSYAGADVRRFG